MSGSATTPILKLTKPVVGGDLDVWGTELNGNFDALDAGVLPLKGGTLLGPLILFREPQGVLEAASKSYVDTAINGVNSGNAGLYLPFTGGTLTGPLLLYRSPQTAAEAATKGYVDARPDEAPSDGVTYGRRNAAWTPVLALAGGTLTGPLLLAADPTIPLGAASKQYVDGRIVGIQANFVPLAGGTMTGKLTLSADPTASLEAASKRYVDVTIGSVAGLPDAPADGTTYGRLNHTYVGVLPLSGATMTGPLILSRTPTNAMEAATKNYAETAAAAALGGALPLSGGTLTGPLVLNADPLLPLGAATRQYVDGKAANYLPLFGGTMTGPIVLPGDPASPTQAATKGYIDRGFLPLSGGTLTGSLTASPSVTIGVNGTSYPTLALNGGAGSDRQLLYQTNGVTRWTAVANGAAESGSNAGSDYTINRYNDAGTFLGVPLSITRSTGAVAIAQGLSVGTALSVGQGLNVTGTTVSATVISTSGRIISQSSSNNSSVCVYDLSQSYAAGMFLGGGKVLYFGKMDGSGTYVGPELGHFDAASNFFAGAQVAAGASVTVGTVLYINYPTITDFYIYRTGGSRYFNWVSNWYDSFRESDGLRSWASPSGNLMTLDGNGYLTLTGTLSSNIWTCRTDGNFLLTPNNGRLLQFTGNTYIQYSTNLLITAVTTGGQNIQMAANGSLTFNQTGAWKPGGGPWSDTSDARIKRVTGDYKSGLAEILKLEPRRAIFLGNDIQVTRENLAAHAEARDGSPDLAPLQSHHAQVAEREQEFVGFVAQEAEQAMPELVSHIHGTIEGEFVQDLRVVDTQPLLYAMVNAFKEIDARLRAVEGRAVPRSSRRPTP